MDLPFPPLLHPALKHEIVQRTSNKVSVHNPSITTVTATRVHTSPVNSTTYLNYLKSANSPLTVVSADFGVFRHSSEVGI